MMKVKFKKPYGRFKVGDVFAFGEGVGHDLVHSLKVAVKYEGKEKEKKDDPVASVEKMARGAKDKAQKNVKNK